MEVSAFLFKITLKLKCHASYTKTKMYKFAQNEIKVLQPPFLSEQSRKIKLLQIQQANRLLGLMNIGYIAY